MPINVLHVALEWGPATYGGLGRVATQMVNAQNRFVVNGVKQSNAAIITPLYPHLYKQIEPKTYVAQVKHLYNSEYVSSNIYLHQNGDDKVYLVEPDQKYKDIFCLTTKPAIYSDTEVSGFLDRVKYLNSAVAAYANDPDNGSQHPNPDILHLHDWQAALVPEILKKVYKNSKVKSVFTIHIDNGDRGTFASDSLQGIGLDFDKQTTVLKAMGMLAADKIVAVSPKFLRELTEVKEQDPDAEYLRKILVLSHVQNKSVGIANGITIEDFKLFNKHYLGTDNVYETKMQLKKLLAQKLCSSRLSWKFDPNLPMILCITRYSPEKGPEVFEQIIRELNGRATFVAIGRGMTPDVFNVLISHSRQTDNVFVTASEKEQAELGELARSAADIFLAPSHRDALNVAMMEARARGSLLVATGVGGMRDAAEPLDTHAKDRIRGNCIFYEDLPQGGYNASLSAAINQALELFEGELNPTQINTMQTQILDGANSLDWLAPDGAIAQYQQVYSALQNAECEMQNKLDKRLHVH